MALDGMFLHHLKNEIENNALGARVDKIYQPSREEILLILRSVSGVHKLFISARANSARINFTAASPENPKQPPMFCMLLRKHLAGSKLSAVRQPKLERMLILDFDTTNDLGDSATLSIAAEIMGKYSNVILIDEKGKIIDALKRVDASMSSERLVLPGLPYKMPPPQDKLCILDSGMQQIIGRIRGIPADVKLSKAILLTLQGVSPVVCRELQYITGRGTELNVHEMNGAQFERLEFFLNRLEGIISGLSGKPYMAIDTATKKPLDFSFIDIHQYEEAAIVSSKESFSAMLEEFYSERDRIARMRARSQDLLRVLTTASERLSRKINVQSAEIKNCAKRDDYRRFGDLINANIYNLEKGQSSAEIEDFYDPALKKIKIKLDPMLTPVRNAQKYYKEYRKSKTAEDVLKVQIEKARRELLYLDTVFDELSRAESEDDLAEIREELRGQGYIRTAHVNGRKNKKVSAQKPMKFISTEGFHIFVGRNNCQNDSLTLKQAKKDDIWFHTKNIPGSHVILSAEGRKVTEKAIGEAAGLAAQYSRGGSSSNVPVDYTIVKNVSKPRGAKPGMVIYVKNKTIFVSPQKTGSIN